MHNAGPMKQRTTFRSASELLISDGWLLIFDG
jgi:hypothetical protein